MVPLNIPTFDYSPPRIFFRLLVPPNFPSMELVLPF